jgi:ankyrin repeat protein
MRTLRISLSLLCFIASATAADAVVSTRPTAEGYRRAIRGNDLPLLKAMCKTGLSEVRDRLDSTPLHYAALYGSTDAVRIVLEAGGDPNARNLSQVTPLMYASYSLEKTRLLIAKGGDVNAKAKDGSTPLGVAIAVPGNEATVRYLIEKGASLKEMTPAGADYLARSASRQDASVLRLLLEKGLDPHSVAKNGTTALLNSIRCGGEEKPRLLTEAGSDVNAADTDAGLVKNGPIESTGETPLMHAAVCGQTSVVADLLKAGAKIDATDTTRHMTALMRAVAMDAARPETASLLISSGADLNIADRNSETALDWARKFRNPAIVALLERAGAKEKGLAPAPIRPSNYVPTAQEAIERASALLAASNIAFFREGGGCTGCHHQPFAGRVFAALKSAGLPLNRAFVRSWWTP